MSISLHNYYSCEEPRKQGRHVRTYRQPHNEQVNTWDLLRVLIWKALQQHLCGKFAAAPQGQVYQRSGVMHVDFFDLLVYGVSRVTYTIDII
jgi:hypothetical protein